MLHIMYIKELLNLCWNLNFIKLGLSYNKHVKHCYILQFNLWIFTQLDVQSKNNFKKKISKICKISICNFDTYAIKNLVFIHTFRAKEASSMTFEIKDVVIKFCALFVIIIVIKIRMLFKPMINQ